MSAPRAAVDVGTNSVRLLVVDADGRPVTRELSITRLGAGVDRSGHLDDEALRRTLDVLARYRDLWDRYGVTDRVRIAATSAVRDAADRQRFFDGVRHRTGIDAEVLSGQEEAAAAFAGAVGAVDPTGPAAVVDVGGGSTEFIVGSDAGVVAGSVSLQVGCVRLTERHLHGDPPTAPELAAARAMVDEHLGEAERVLATQDATLSGASALIGVAGTATTLAALHLGLDTYDPARIHASRIPAPALHRLTAELTAMTVAERATLGAVQPGREDVLHGGAVVLSQAVARFGSAELLVSEADILDGLVASLDAAATP